MTLKLNGFRDPGCMNEPALPKENNPQLHTEPGILRETIVKVITQKKVHILTKVPLLGPER